MTLHPTRREAEGILQQEIKWARFPDTVYEMYTFEYVLNRYAKHVIFLQFVSVWYDRTCDEKTRDEMMQFLNNTHVVGEQ